MDEDEEEKEEEELVTGESTSVSSSGKRSEKSRSLMRSNGRLVLGLTLHEPEMYESFLITGEVFNAFVPDDDADEEDNADADEDERDVALRIRSRMAFTPIDEPLISLSRMLLTFDAVELFTGVQFLPSVNFLIETHPLPLDELLRLLLLLLLLLL